jgi:hypothetical protein
MSGRLVGWIRELFGRAAMAVGGPCDFEIRHRPGVGTTVRGPIARAKHGAIDEFFRRDLDPIAAVAIRGAWRRGGALDLRFSGPIDASGRQRARNFLLHHLR